MFRLSVFPSSVPYAAVTTLSLVISLLGSKWIQSSEESRAVYKPLVALGSFKVLFQWHVD